jgi:hypothetical protein
MKKRMKNFGMMVIVIITLSVYSANLVVANTIPTDPPYDGGNGTPPPPPPPPPIDPTQR